MKKNILFMVIFLMLFAGCTNMTEQSEEPKMNLENEEISNGNSILENQNSNNINSVDEINDMEVSKQVPNTDPNKPYDFEAAQRAHNFDYEHYYFQDLFEGEQLTPEEAKEKTFENNIKKFAFYYHQGMTPVGIIYDNRYDKMYFSSSTGGGFYIDYADLFQNIVELTPEDMTGLEKELERVNFHNWNGNWYDSTDKDSMDATFVWTVAVEYNDGTIERYGGGAVRNFPEGFDELKNYLFNLMDTLPQERELLEAEVYME